MPLQRPPWKIEGHRISAISLYRAILTQCSAVPLGSVRDTERLKNLTRNRFHANRRVQSPRLLHEAFKAGYEALDILDAAATGHQPSLGRLTKLLVRTPLRTDPPIAPSPPDKTLACAPPSQKLIEIRPRPELDEGQIRQIPVLVNANKLPFLRFKKPQPRNVSRVIRQTLDTRVRRLNIVQELAEWWLPIAKWEDQWDKTVTSEVEVEAAIREGGRAAGRKTGQQSLKKPMAGQKNRGSNAPQSGKMNSTTEPGWVDAVQDGIVHMNMLHAESQRKSVDLADKMQNIVDRETELARMEAEMREMKEARSKGERKKTI